LTTTGYDTAFNGHNYISYNQNQALPNGLLTNALFTGNNPRTLVAVYDTPAYGTAAAPANGTFGALAAGQASPPGGSFGLWFALESRQNNVMGNPYLVNYGPDISSGSAPVAHQLTFALGTYDPGSGPGDGTETLYWAYGLTGAVQSATVGGLTLNTNTNIFTEGSAPGEASSPIDVGDVLVFNTGFSSAQAIAEIEALQASYVPEPTSAVAFCGLGAIGLFMFVRSRSGSRKPKLTALVLTALLCVVLGSAGSASAQTAIYNPDDFGNVAAPTPIIGMTNDGSGGPCRQFERRCHGLQPRQCRLQPDFQWPQLREPGQRPNPVDGERLVHRQQRPRYRRGLRYAGHCSGRQLRR
jgi:hypothetical protein